MFINKLKGSIFYRDKIIDVTEIKEKIQIIKENLADCYKVNDKIIVYLDRTPELLMVLYALFDLNITYIPIDPSMPQKRINYIVELVDADGVIVSNPNSIKVDKCMNIIRLDDLICKAKGKYTGISTCVHIDCDKIISYIIFTSGSTGNPKGVMIKKSSLINLMRGVSERIDYSVGKKMLCLTTVGFDIFFLESIMAMYFGVDIVLADTEQQKNPREISKLLLEKEVDMIQITPSRLQQLYRLDNSLACLKKVESIMIGGEQFSDNMLLILKKATQGHIFNLYGPTETTVWSTISELSEKEICDLGEPICNTQIYIYDEEINRICEEGRGEIYISGDGLAKGYYKLPGLTKEKFVEIDGERLYRTGDYGYYNKSGNLIYLGRTDNQVKVRGYRIELEEIEKVMMNISDIRQAACVLIGENENRKIVGFYSADKQIEFLEIRSILLEEIPNYMVPEILIQEDELPFSSNGKIDRNALKEIAISKASTKEIKESFLLDELSIKVFKIVSECLTKDSITESILNENFETIGFDSIEYVSMIVELEMEFGIEFSEECLVIQYFKNFYDLVEYLKGLVK